MTREGEELTRERMRGTDESPRRLWERSSSVRFVKEAKGEIQMATTKRNFSGRAKEKRQKDGQTNFG